MRERRRWRTHVELELHLGERLEVESVLHGGHRLDRIRHTTTETRPERPMTGSMAPRSSELVRVVDARALAWTAARANEWRGARAPVAWARMTVGTTKATTRRRAFVSASAWFRRSAKPANLSRSLREPPYPRRPPHRTARTERVFSRTAPYPPPFLPRVSRASSSSRRSARPELSRSSMSAAPAEMCRWSSSSRRAWTPRARLRRDPRGAAPSIHRRRHAGVHEKGRGRPRSALTEADTAAQIAIVNALRTAWPGLRIVGEEEEEESPDKGAAPVAPLDDAPPIPPPSPGANLDVLTVFVDLSTAPASSSRSSRRRSASSASRAAAAPSLAPSAFPSRTAISSVPPPSNGASALPGAASGAADPSATEPLGLASRPTSSTAGVRRGDSPTPASPRRAARVRGARVHRRRERFSPWRRGARRCPSCT